jgi:hypothetical protein
VYEKEPDAVTATPEMMAENVFGKGYAGVFVLRVVGGEDDGKAVGFALVSVCTVQCCVSLRSQYFFTYSTWLGVPGLYVSRPPV